MTSIDNTLVERGSRYGEFAKHANISMALKRVMHDTDRWETMPDDMQEALDMVAHKIGRILNGSPTYRDNWHDISGYATLIERRLCDGEEYDSTT